MTFILIVRSTDILFYQLMRVSLVDMRSIVKNALN